MHDCFKILLLHRVLSCCVSVTPTQQLNEVLMQQLIWLDRGPFRGSEAHCGGDVFMFCWVSYVKNFSNTLSGSVERRLLGTLWVQRIALLLPLHFITSCTKFFTFLWCWWDIFESTVVHCESTGFLLMQSQQLRYISGICVWIYSLVSCTFINSPSCWSKPEWRLGLSRIKMTK